ncbi:hypothetical protein DLAC_02270 [Tieghemostelium lacteum]|uniref:Transmembrane protein n=1 Tax=Tieghemostelium lacteum TaxID=361077 RepID=A0A152A502_TIELA|nr:hypothetical protein DLAC_02270 [Tieghemostelium lacteum]|eukprot:KYR01161.1 hypothetical protein DLAC_02270 [Tieghemostelium lacteum]
MNTLILSIILSFLFIIFVHSDPNCIIGGIEADSCVNSRYIFNGDSYVIEQEIKLQNGTVLEFGENTTVTFERSSSLHFQCTPSTDNKYYIFCKQIIVKGIINSNAGFFTADLNLVEFLNENGNTPNLIYFGETASPQSDQYSPNSVSLTWPLFYLNLITNDDFNCSYYSIQESDRLFDVKIECDSKPISKPIDLNVTYSFCKDEYLAFNNIISNGVLQYSVPNQLFYVKDYLVEPPSGQGVNMVSSGFYLRLYPGFDFSYNLNDFISLVSQQKYTEMCGTVLPVKSSYIIVTPYGVTPLPITNPPNTVEPNSQDSKDDSVSSHIKVSPNLNFMVFIITIVYIIFVKMK